MPEEQQSGRERVIELARRRRRNAFVKSLAIFFATAAGFCCLVYFGWDKFKRTGVYQGFSRGESGGFKDPDLMPDGGFHIVEDSYWSIFDSAEASEPPSAPGKPKDKPPEGGARPRGPDGAKPAAGGGEVDAEGLDVRKMDDEGPYTVSGDMGGLIATRVGVWKSPNKLGTGQIAFYCEHLEQATVTHWARNLLGFRVYRVTKEGRAGWVLGHCLLGKDGEPLK